MNMADWIFNNGYAGYFNGWVNPYAVDSDQYRFWELGYKKAEKDATSNND